MLLVLQIAAGIVLAYAIVKQRRAILLLAKWVIVVALIFAVCCGVLALLWVFIQPIALMLREYLGDLSARNPLLGTIAQVFALLMAIVLTVPITLFGAHSLVKLWEALGWVKEGEADSAVWPFAAASTINILLGCALLKFLGHDLFTGSGIFSSNWGIKEDGSDALFTVVQLWSLLPTWLINLRERRLARLSSKSDER